MTNIERKCLILSKWRTIEAGAKALECNRSALSACIHKRRVSQHIREKLAQALGMTVEELFGDSPAENGDNSPNADSTDNKRKHRSPDSAQSAYPARSV